MIQPLINGWHECTAHEIGNLDEHIRTFALLLASHESKDGNRVVLDGAPKHDEDLYDAVRGLYYEFWIPEIPEDDIEHGAALVLGRLFVRHEWKWCWRQFGATQHMGIYSSALDEVVDLDPTEIKRHALEINDRCVDFSGYISAIRITYETRSGIREWDADVEGKSF